MKNLFRLMMLLTVSVLTFSCQPSKPSDKIYSQYETIVPDDPSPNILTGIVKKVETIHYQKNNIGERSGTGAALGVASHFLLGTGFTKSVVTGTALGAATSSNKTLIRTEVWVYNPDLNQTDLIQFNTSVPYSQGDTITYLPQDIIR